jgi:hypothetical protein
MPNNADLWKLDSGLRADFDFTVHSAYFSTHADYQAGQQLLLFLIGTDNSDEEPVEIRMSLGADWVTGDGGNTIRHPKSENKHIQKNSIYGHWIEHSLRIPTLEQFLLTQDPRDARTWIGLTLHLDMAELTFGKNIDPQERLMPTSLIGQQAQSALTEPTTPARVDPATLVAEAKARKQPSTNGSGLRTEMIRLAKESPSFEEFLESALQNDDVLADTTLSMECADQDKIWAEAHN